MKVLSFSLDPQILNKDSVVASRTIRYGEVLDAFTVVVPSSFASTLTLSPRATVYGTGGRFKLQQLWRMYRIARGLLKDGSYDVVSSQDTYFLGLLALLLGFQFHCGVEVQVLGIEKLSFLRKRLSRFVLRRAGSIRVLSLGLKERLLQEFMLREDRMMLVPIYVDVSSLGFTEQDQSPEVHETLRRNNAAFIEKYSGRFNIISVNRLVPIKNIPMQLEAVQALKASHPNILLHIIGDGPLQKELQEKVANMGLRDCVHFAGYQSGASLSPYFTQSDCFILTSDFEGYGMVVIEAATAGLPIVMTDVGCAGEVIINGKSGLVVPPRDTAAFTRALRSVMDDQALRTHLAQGAVQSIAELPSFDTVLEKYKMSWQQAIDNKIKI